MRLHSLTKALGIAAHSVGMGTLIAVLNIQMALAGSPSWWLSRQVLTIDAQTGLPVLEKDYSAVNAGQLKHIARKAYDELKAALPPAAWSTGTAGPALEALIKSWYVNPQTMTDPKLGADFTIINQGQLKNVAKPFYDLFAQENIDVSEIVGDLTGERIYPWTNSTDDDANYAAVTMGQVKRVFSFGLDIDDDHLSDWWENRIVNARSDDNITSINQVIGTDDFDGDGLTNQDEYDFHTDATVYSQDVPSDGLRTWLKGDAGITQVAGAVTSWADQSGNTNHFNAPTDASRRPHVTSNPLNALPVVAFDGANDLLQASTLGTIADTFTVFVVAKANATINTNISDPLAGTSNQRYLLFPHNGGSNAGAGLSVGSNGISVIEHGTDYMPANASYFGSGMAGPAFKVIELSYLDKRPSIALNGNSEPPGTLSPRSSVVLGNSLGDSTSFNYGAFSGEVGEVLIFNRQLSTLERKLVRNHLAYRWMDQDGDNLPDGWEVVNRFSRTDSYSADPNDAVLDGDYDSDGDGLTNRREYELGSDPHSKTSGLNQALLASWEGDEANLSTVVADSSGLNHHGVFIGDGERSTGVTGQNVLRLNSGAASASEFVLITEGEDINLDASKSFSLAFWFKTTSNVAKRIVGRGSYQWSNGFFAGIGNTSPGCITFGVGAGGSQANSLQFSTDPTDGTFNGGGWHHAVVVFNREEQKASLHVDNGPKKLIKTEGTGGVLATPSTINISALSGLNGNSAEELTIGARSRISAGQPVYDEFFQGDVGDIRLYRIALRGEEINTLYTDVDADGDHMPNWWEDLHDLDKDDPTDANEDPDQDGATNLEEYRNGTDPKESVAPTFTHESGHYPRRFDTLLTAPANTIIRYTTDGSDPTVDSPEFPDDAPPPGIPIDRSLTLKARAWTDGLAPSRTVSATYELTGMIAAGTAHALIQRTDGIMTGWGDNSKKQISFGEPATALKVPIAIDELNQKKIRAFSAGQLHSVALLDDQSVWAWGWNDYGQTGYFATSAENAAPTQVQTIASTASVPVYLSNIVQVSAGAHFAAALTPEGEVWTWGSHSAGQLGANISTNTGKNPKARKVLTRDNIGLIGITKIATGASFTLALDPAGLGTIWSWGSNGDGQLGQGLNIVNSPAKAYATAIPRFLPTPPAPQPSQPAPQPSQQVIDVGAGRFSAFAICGIAPITGDSEAVANAKRAAYTLWAWGLNANRQSGSLSTGDALNTPRQVVSDGSGVPFLGAVAVSGGELHTIALKWDGTVWGWGSTSRTRLGYLAPSEDNIREYPKPIMLNAQEALNDVVAIDAGDHFSAALKRDGTIIIWGDNELGQHGNGITWNHTRVGDVSWHRLVDNAEFADTDHDGYPDVFEFANDGNHQSSDPATGIPTPTFTVSGDGTEDFATIQEAIDAVTTDRAIILVKPGTYYGSIAIPAESKILLISENGAEDTIIDAWKEPAGIYVNSDSTINGFTIKNAFGDTNGVLHNGGAIFVDQCRPIFTRCFITANRAKDGAAVYNNFGMPTFTYCTFAFNQSVNSQPGQSGILGPAVFSDGLKARFQNCVLLNRQTYGEIGGTGAQVSNSYFWTSGPANPPIISVDNTSTSNLTLVGSLAGGHLMAGSILRNDKADPSVATSYDLDHEKDGNWDNPLIPNVRDIGVDEYYDYDTDGIPDWWEKDNGSNPLVQDANTTEDGSSETYMAQYTEDISGEPIDEPIGEIPETISYVVDDNLAHDAEGNAFPTNDGTGMLLFPTSGAWTTTTTPSGKKGVNCLETSIPGAYVQFVPWLPTSGAYQVAISWPHGTYHEKTEVEILDAQGKILAALRVNQSKQDDKWNSIGIFPFQVGTTGKGGSVIIRKPAGSLKVVADAVSFTPIAPQVELSATAANQEGTYLASNIGSTAKSAWKLRKLAGIPGATASKVRISKTRNASFSFLPQLKVAGNYRVYLRWQNLGTKLKSSNKVRVEITHAGGLWTGYVNQTAPVIPPPPATPPPDKRGSWILLSATPFVFLEANGAVAPQIKVFVPDETPVPNSTNPSIWNGQWVNVDAVRLEKVVDEAFYVDDRNPGTTYQPSGNKWVVKEDVSMKAVGFGRGYKIISKSPSESDEFQFETTVEREGNYGVYVYGPSGKNFVSEAILNVNGTEFTYSQQLGGSRLRPLGQVYLEGKAQIQIRRGSGTGVHLAADTVALIRDPDNDHDGLLDTWEDNYPGMDLTSDDQDHNQQRDDLDDFDGDGVLNGVEAANGTDPFNYDGTSPQIAKVTGDNVHTGALDDSGDFQTGEPASVLSKPLRVRVRNAKYNPTAEHDDPNSIEYLINAPVTFELPEGGPTGTAAALAISPDADFGGEGEALQSRTDALGYAEAYVRLPADNWRDQNRIARDLRVKVSTGQVTLKNAATTSGSTTVTVATNAFLFSGMTVTGTGIPPGATISSVPTGSDTTHFALSIPAMATATQLELVATSEVIFTAGIKGLAGHWDVDETTGSLAKDSTTYGSHGSVFGSGHVWGSPTVENWRKALHFDGSATSRLLIANGFCAVFPNSPATAAMRHPSFSLAFWFRPDSVGTQQQAILSHAIGSERLVIAAKQDPVNSSNMLVILTRPNLENISPTPPYANTLTSSFSVAKTTWCHVLVANHGHEVNLYLSGVFAGTLPGWLPASSNPIQVGGAVTGWANFAGSIDEVQVFRGALGVDEAVVLSTGDSDWDGIPNWWEVARGMNIFDPSDAWGAPDAHGVHPYGQYRLYMADIAHGGLDEDNDDILDGWEANHNLKLHVADAYEDPDGDLYPNIFEYKQQPYTDPQQAASFPQPDGTDNIIEVAAGTGIATIAAALTKHGTDNRSFQIIRLRAGTYEGNVSVADNTKPFLLIGESGARRCRIAGGGLDSIISIGAGVKCAIAGVEIADGDTTGVGGQGGGLRIVGATSNRSAVFLNSCMLRNNRSADGASAIWAQDASVHVSQSTILGANEPGINLYPSTIATGAGGSVQLANAICWNPDSTAEISPASLSSVQLDYTCIRGGLAGLSGEGNISVVDPKLTPDGHLMHNSPCRTIGRKEGMPAFDWDGDPRIAGAPDLGIDEFFDSDGDHMPDYWETEHHLDPVDARDAAWNSDGDAQSHTNLYAYEHGESPWLADDPFDPEPNDESTTGLRIAGATKGELSVGADGAATYTVPLYIPKGTAGMEPKLSLTYSSKAGNGPIGVGWSLTGLSTITRGPATLAQDNAVQGVNLDDNDKFHLDGQRLMQVPGETYYDTEIRSFSRVTKPNTDDPASQWVVETKAGLTMWFGAALRTGNDNNSGKPIIWAVKKVADKSGNYFTVSYHPSGEPDKIEYTGNSQLDPYNQVKFVYQDTPRTDKTFNYVAGRLLWRDKLMTKIEMYSESVSEASDKRVRTYELKYSYSGSTDRARLVRLIELGTPPLTIGAGDAASYGSIRHKLGELAFDWQGWRNDKDRGWAYHAGWTSPFPMLLAQKKDSRGAMFMDVNGDGFQDLIWNRHRYPDEENEDGEFDRGAYLNPGVPGAAWVLAPQFAPPYPLIAEGGGDTGARFVDIDANGFPDLIARGEYMILNVQDHTKAPKSQTLNDAWESGIWSLHPGLGWIKKNSNLGLMLATVDGGKREDKRTVHFVDLSGDALPELLVANDESNPKTAVYSFNGTFSRRNANSLTSALNGKVLVGVNHGFCDLNGDGLPELVYNRKQQDTDSGFYSWTKESGEKWKATALTLATLPNLPTAKNAFIDAGARFVDLNGDGNPDYWLAQRKGFASDTPPRAALLGKGRQTGATTLPQWGSSTPVAGIDYSVPDGIFLSQYVNENINGGFGDAEERALDMGNRLLDVNGDGLVDLLVSFKSHDTIHEIGATTISGAFINTGVGFQSVPEWIPPGTIAEVESTNENNEHVNIGLGAYLMDINGDGFPDFVQAREGADGALLKQIHINKAKPQVIVQVRSGVDITDRIAYKPLTSPAVYTRGGGGKKINLEEQDVIVPMHVVQRVEHNNGVGGFNSTRYKYTGLRTNLRGRGSQGFHTLEVIDEDRNISTKTTYNQRFPLTGTIGNTKRMMGDTGKPRKTILAETQNEWLKTAQELGKPVVVYLSQSKVTSNNIDGKLISETISTYKQDLTTGNLLDGTVQLAEGFSKKTINSYPQGDALAAWLGRIEKTKVFHNAPGASADRTSEFEYLNGTGPLTSETAEPGDGSGPDHAGSATTTYENFDPFGQAQTTKTEGYDLNELNGSNNPIFSPAANRVSTTIRDNRGRFVLSTSNALGHKASTVTEPRLGVPIRTTDANGLVARNTAFDGFGRVLESVSTNDIIITTSYQFFGPGELGSGDVESRTRYKVTTRQSKAGVNFPPTVVWMDFMNREIRKETYSAIKITPEDNAPAVYQDTIYDRFGRSEKVSAPYLSNDASPTAKVMQKSKYDHLDRKTSVQGDDGSRTMFAYAARPGGGMEVRGTVERGAGAAALVTRTITNAAGQVTQVIDADDGTTRYEYDAIGNAVRTIGVDDSVIEVKLDRYGRKVKMVDPNLGGWNNPGGNSNLGAWQYQYNSFGELVWQKDPKGQVSAIKRDVLGRVIKHWERGSPTPGVGNRETTSTYDEAARANAPAAPPGQPANYYGKWKGMLQKVQCNTLSYEESYGYDDRGRVEKTITKVESHTFVSGQTYDTFGRPDVVTYPAKSGPEGQENVGVQVKNDYAANGFHRSAKRLAYQPPVGTAEPERIIWYIDPATVNARGQATQQFLGGKENSGSDKKLVTIANIFGQKTGRLNATSATVGGVNLPVPDPTPTLLAQDSTYTYDLIGTLKSRQYGVSTGMPLGKVESFEYDALNRLKQSIVNSSGGGTPQPSNYNYDPNGNLRVKQGITDYTYPGDSNEKPKAGPHAVIAVALTGISQDFKYEYDDNGNLIKGPAWDFVSGAHVRGGRTITYWQNDKPLTITDSQTTLTMHYGPSGGLLKKHATGAHAGTTYYVGSFEYEERSGGNKIYRHHFGSAVFTVTESGATFTCETHYLLKDHLGSAEVILKFNASAELVSRERYSFDSFGQRRNADLSVAITKIRCSVTQKGYTGHEQLDDVDLIHMIGRVYDPFIGRFLSADPVIQADANSQAYNRYSYVQNNPLSLTDPTGNIAAGDWFTPWGHGKIAIEAHRETLKWLRENPVVAQVVVAVAVVVVSVLTFGAATAALVPTLGTFWGGLAGAALAGAAGGFVSGTLSTAIAGGSLSEVLTVGIKSAAIGAVKAAAAFGVAAAGTAFLGAGPLADLATGLAQGVVQGALEAAQGGEFVTGFVAGFAGAVSGSITSAIPGTDFLARALRTMIAATIGGTAAELTGGSFANGAVTAAFVHLAREFGPRLSRTPSKEEEAPAQAKAGPREPNIKGTVTIGPIRSVTTDDLARNHSGHGYVFDSSVAAFAYVGGGGGTQTVYLDNGDIAVYTYWQAGVGVGGKLPAKVLTDLVGAGAYVGEVHQVYYPADYSGSFWSLSLNAGVGISISWWPGGSTSGAVGVSAGIGASATYQRYYLQAVQHEGLWYYPP